MQPFAEWAHPCKYVFVNTIDTTLIVIDGQLGASFPTDVLLRKKVEYYLPTPILKKNNLTDTVSNQSSIQKSSQYLPERNFVIIINGGYDLENNNIRYWNNCSLVYKILVENCYEPDKIWVLSSDGTDGALDTNYASGAPPISQNLDLDGNGINDITNSATKANISIVFDAIKGELAKNALMNYYSNVFIYVTDHGKLITGGTTSADVRIALWGEYMSPAEFITELRKIKGANFIQILMDQCNSGGFADEIKKTDINAIISTSCAFNQTAWSVRDNYGCYIYNWLSGIRGKRLEDETNINNEVDTNLDNFISFAEASEYAKKQSQPGSYFWKKHPNIHPTIMSSQYNSKPLSVGNYLALDNIKSEAYCYNGKQDNGERGIDCGGTCGSQCVTIVTPPEPIATCYDGIKNQDETDIDCGGSNCAPCGIGGNLNNTISASTCECVDAGLGVSTNNNVSLFSGSNIFGLNRIKLSHGSYENLSQWSYSPSIRCHNQTKLTTITSDLKGGIFFEQSGYQFAPDKLYKLSFNYWLNYGKLNLKLANGLISSTYKTPYHYQLGGSYLSDGYIYKSTLTSPPQVSSSFYIGYVNRASPSTACIYYDDDEEYRYTEVSIFFKPDNYYSQLWLYTDQGASAFPINSIKLQEMCIPDLVFNEDNTKTESLLTNGILVISVLSDGEARNVANPSRVSNSITFDNFVFKPRSSYSFISGNSVLLKNNTVISSVYEGSVHISIDKNVCSSSSQSVKILDDNSPQDIIPSNYTVTNSKIKLYPNPTASIIYIDNQSLETYSVAIYDFSGKLVKEVPECNGTINVSLSDFPKGIYAFKISSATSLSLEKVIKE